MGDFHKPLARAELLGKLSCLGYCSPVFCTGNDSGCVTGWASQTMRPSACAVVSLLSVAGGLCEGARPPVVTLPHTRSGLLMGSEGPHTTKEVSFPNKIHTPKKQLRRAG